MPMPVDSDRMAGSRDLCRQRPVTLDLLADKEERRDPVPSCQLLEHGGCST